MEYLAIQLGKIKIKLYHYPVFLGILRKSWILLKLQSIIVISHFALTCLPGTSKISSHLLERQILKNKTSGSLGLQTHKKFTCGK